MGGCRQGGGATQTCPSIVRREITHGAVPGKVQTIRSARWDHRHRVGIVGIANFVIYAASKVAEGHGLDFYMSGSGAKTTYISTIVLFVILPIVLGAAWAWSRWSKYD